MAFILRASGLVSQVAYRVGQVLMQADPLRCNGRPASQANERNFLLEKPPCPENCLGRVGGVLSQTAS
jgi:hypothetical protein